MSSTSGIEFVRNGIVCIVACATVFALGFNTGAMQYSKPEPVVLQIMEPYNWKVTRIIDGDTFEVDATFFPREMGRIQVRIKGVDTPESGHRAKCASEREKAIVAKELAAEMLLGKVVQISGIEQDKYGGRLVAVVSSNGIPYSQLLISKQLAVPYEGKTKQSWC